MDAFKRLFEVVRANRLFKRNKVSVEEKVLAILLYLAGLSLRAITERYGLIKASKEAVRIWIHKIFNLPWLTKA